MNISHNWYNRAPYAKSRFKLIIAAGGTGGHLFPAQTLVDQLKKEEPQIQSVFVGAYLANNRYFRKEHYTYYEVESATPLRGSFVAKLKALWRLLLGIGKSFSIFMKEKPDLVIGFGSFHSFPVLCAARLCRTPIILFEPNIHPGKVNRVFSASVLFTAVIFPKSDQWLKGKTQLINMPVFRRKEEGFETLHEKVGYFSLKAEAPIILVFGGSQGAARINELWFECVGQVKWPSFQVIHIVGNKGNVESLRQMYAAQQIPACVREFESRMFLAYEVATLAICRSGAATLAELIAFEIPSILIPFPQAAEDHQMKNAVFLAEEIGGARYFPEKVLNQEILLESVNELCPDSANFIEMKRCLREYKRRYAYGELWQIIQKEIQKLKN